jgi:TetR/AcrR family transcriptional repressor of nem operon
MYCDDQYIIYRGSIVMKIEQRAAGRPREFQPDEAAQLALAVFWPRGYHDVSVPELEKATGVVRTSLYNTFGNKRGLFDAALDAYLTQLYDDIDAALTNSESGLEDVHAFLDQLETWHTSGVPGCFMINSMVEFAETDAAIMSRGEEYLDKLQAGYHAVLTRARARGELADESRIDLQVGQLLLLTIGLNTAARTAVGTDRLRTLYQAAHAAVHALEQHSNESTS